jgi:hypothetical protein
MRLHSPATRTHTYSVVKEHRGQRLEKLPKLASQSTLPKDDQANQLNAVIYCKMELMGIEPTTPGLQSRCSPS